MSSDRCRPKGKVKVGPCGVGSGRTLGAVSGGGEDDDEAFSVFSLSCLSLLKYRSEANSVIWRGSMMSCVWQLCHPVAEMK